MDYSDIDKVVEYMHPDDVNEQLSAGWILLSVAPGKNEDGLPYNLYSLGHHAEYKETLQEWK